MSLFVLLVAGCGDPQPGTLRIGDRFPPLELLSLSATDEPEWLDFKQKVVILNIWAPWCPPCLDEMPSLERLSRKLDPQRFEVIGITIDDRFLAEEFLSRVGVSYRNYYDPSRQVVEGLLGTRSYPETLVIGRNGVLLRRIRGWQPWDASDSIKDLERLFDETMIEESLSER